MASTTTVCSFIWTVWISGELYRDRKTNKQRVR
jgi:hypothetical protein